MAHVARLAITRAGIWSFQLHDGRLSAVLGCRMTTMNKVCANFYLERHSFFAMTCLPIEDDDTIFEHRTKCLLICSAHLLGENIIEMRIYVRLNCNHRKCQIHSWVDSTIWFWVHHSQDNEALNCRQWLPAPSAFCDCKIHSGCISLVREERTSFLSFLLLNVVKRQLENLIYVVGNT